MKLLLASLVLTGLLGMTAAGQTAWYYHVKTGGTGGKPVQSEADPGLSSCWNSINAAFAAVKNRTTPGPWIIQVDDEATYDEAVALVDLQTSSTETLTLAKAAWLVGRPTIYPSQRCQSALAINGRWLQADDPPNQPRPTSRQVTYVTVRGFILKNNAAGTGKTNQLNLFTDNQADLTEGLHIIEDCHFDGQNQVYDARVPILIRGTCINTVFHRNVVRDFTINDDSRKGQGIVFLTGMPVSTVVGQPQITVADNTFYGNHGNNRGCVFEAFNNAANQRYYKVVLERNTFSGNSRSHMVAITDNPLSNLIRNNIFSGNLSNTWDATLQIHNSSNTKVHNNTFFNNHARWEVFVTTGSREGVAIKNNLFWPTPGSYCIEVQPGCTQKLVSANNAFFTDFKNDGYPPGFGFSTTENTQTVGLWGGEAMTTDAWNKTSTNNTGNGYTLEGPGLARNLHLVAGSLCIDRGVSGLVSDDFDGGQRPVGAGCDIGADEYGTTGKAISPGSEQEPALEFQQLALGAPIHFAAFRGDLAKIEASIREGVDLNKLDGRGYAPLHHAAQNNQKQAIELLIAKGGDVNVKNLRGQTPLFYAIAAGHKDVAELLIAKGAEVNLKNKNRQAALDFSLSQNRKDIVEFLIAEASIGTAVKLGEMDKVRSCLEKGVDVNAKDKDGQTALHVAAANKRMDVAELLLSHGADLNAKDRDGYTPLFYAFWKEGQDLVKLLVTKGAQVNYTPKGDYPPLHYAVWNHDVNIVKLLVDHGAQFDVKDKDGSTAFREAASEGASELLKVFITKGADVSTLPLAACLGDLRRMKALVEQGADINAKDELGWTPLYWAASTGQTEAAEFLVAKGADVQAKTTDEATPLHQAASAGEVRLVEMLISKGVGVNVKDKRGNTPLHRAVRAGHKAMVELLIARGADASIRDYRDRTVLDLAEQLRDRAEIAEILRQHAAKK